MNDKLFDHKHGELVLQKLSESYTDNPEQFYKILNAIVHESESPTSEPDALILYAIHKAHRFGKVDELSDMIATWADTHVLPDICHDAEFNVDDE